MIQNPKSHWPPPSREFVPDGWLSTFQAFNLVGRDRFPDKWLDGKEFAAPSDEEIEANREASARRESRAAERPRRIEKAKRASRRVVSGSDLPQVRTARPKRSAALYKGQPFPVDVIADEGVRKAARERGDAVWEEIRQWLYAGTVLAAYLDDQGELREVAESTWARPIAMPVLLTGQGRADGTIGPVLISKPHLEAAIRGEPVAGQTAAQELRAPEDRVAAPILPPAARTPGIATAPRSADPKQNSNKPGRPSQKAGIETAYKKLHDDGKIDFSSKKANYPAIREKITGSRAKTPGLRDDAIRKAIKPFFDADKAKAKDAP